MHANDNTGGEEDRAAADRRRPDTRYGRLPEEATRLGKFKRSTKEDNSASRSRAYMINTGSATRHQTLDAATRRPHGATRAA